MLPQHTSPMPHVSNKLVKPCPGFYVAHTFFDLVDAANLQHSGTPGFALIEPSLTIRLDKHVEIGPQFLVKFAFYSRSLKKVSDDAHIVSYRKPIRKYFQYLSGVNRRVHESCAGSTNASGEFTESW